MLEQLKERVCRANRQLVSAGLVIQTFGNVSGIDRASGCVVIKPSGLPYDQMKPQDMAVVRVSDSQVVEGRLRPSSDTPTHLELYRAFPEIGGVVHTHSPMATAWAQACTELPALGTTHADYFHGPVPCTRPLTAAEIAGEYEAAIGRAIVERFAGPPNVDPMAVPGALVAGHGPFIWGLDPDEAVHNAIILEYLADLASQTLRINPAAGPIERCLLDQHYFRKHGPAKRYGQA